MAFLVFVAFVTLMVKVIVIAVSRGTRLPRDKVEIERSCPKLAKVTSDR